MSRPEQNKRSDRLSGCAVRFSKVLFIARRTGWIHPSRGDRMEIIELPGLHGEEKLTYRHKYLNQADSERHKRGTDRIFRRGLREISTASRGSGRAQPGARDRYTLENRRAHREGKNGKECSDSEWPRIPGRAEFRTEKGSRERVKRPALPSVWSGTPWRHIIYERPRMPGASSSHDRSIWVKSCRSR